MGYRIISRKGKVKSESTMGPKASEKIDLSSLQSRGAIIWGRLPGFPVWPCRFTSKAEENNLASKKAKSAKIDQVAVVFLGKYLEK